MKINSRQKGASAEREVAKLLESWWNNVEPGSKFFRTPSSGGWQNSHIRGDKEVAGDVGTTAKTFCFTVEIKFRNNWSEKNFILGKKSPVWSWYEQAIRQAKEENKFPMLFFRRNREPWRILVPVQLKKYMKGCTPAAEWDSGDIPCEYENYFPICYWVKDERKK